MFIPPLPPDLMVRSHHSRFQGRPPRPARLSGGPGLPAAPERFRLGELPMEAQVQAPVAPRSPAPAPAPAVPPLGWRVWLGRQLIALGQWMAGDGRMASAGLRQVGGAD